MSPRVKREVSFPGSHEASPRNEIPRRPSALLGMTNRAVRFSETNYRFGLEIYGPEIAHLAATLQISGFDIVAMGEDQQPAFPFGLAQ